MNGTRAFAGRTVKELLRDPLNLAFGLGFPLVLLLLMTAIQANIPVSIFELDTLTPGVAIFGLSFISLFSATLISKDRTTSFLMRLFASPLSAGGFITAYTMPLLPMALAQTVVCYACAAALGMHMTLNVLLAIVTTIPAALLFIGIGLLCGSVFNDKQVGGICGALLTNVSAWLSGTWFDLNLVGGVFKKLLCAAFCARGGSRARGGGGELQRDYAAPLVGDCVRGRGVYAGGCRVPQKDAPGQYLGSER